MQRFFEALESANKRVERDRFDLLIVVKVPIGTALQPGTIMPVDVYKAQAEKIKQPCAYQACFCLNFVGTSHKLWPLSQAFESLEQVKQFLITTIGCQPRRAMTLVSRVNDFDMTPDIREVREMMQGYIGLNDVHRLFE